MLILVFESLRELVSQLGLTSLANQLRQRTPAVVVDQLGHENGLEALEQAESRIREQRPDPVLHLAFGLLSSRAFQVGPKSIHRAYEQRTVLLLMLSDPLEILSARSSLVAPVLVEPRCQLLVQARDHALESQALSQALL